MMRYVFVSFFSILYVVSTMSQVKVSVSWDKDTIELGEEVDLSLFVMTPEGLNVSDVSGGFLDSLISGFQTVKMRQSDSTRSEDFEYADIELSNYGNFKNEDNNGHFNGTELEWNKSELNGDVLLSNKFRLRIWDPGQIIANNPSVQYQYQGDHLINNEPFQAALFVRPPFDVAEMEKDSFDISPIKTIIKEPIEFKDYLIYIYIAAALLGLWLAYTLYQRYATGKEEKPVEEIKIIIPAHKIALEKLHILNKKKLWENDIKSYQSELTFVVREYLENRFKIPALESTTDEIVSGIKSKNLDQNQMSEMKNILQVADLVKFAKSKPSMNIHQKFMTKAFDFVNETMEKEEVIEV